MAKSDRDYSIKEEPKRRSIFSSVLATILLIFAVAVAVAAVFVVFLLKDVTANLPTKQEMLSHESSLATSIYDRNGKLITRLFQENRTLVKFDDISPWMVRAILAAEDDEFYDHAGIRPIAVLRAGIVDLLHKGAKQGASTITQQLARNLFLSQEKTMIRKVKEAVLAVKLEDIYSKQELLEMYLNTIYLGGGTYGIGAAAKFYFDKEPKDLDINESAIIAGLVAAPEKYSPFKHADLCQRRKTYVLKRMLDLNWISKEDYDANINKTPKLSKSRKRTKSSISFNTAPYFVSYILFNQLLPEYGKDGVYRGGLKVNTTIDLDLQRKAEQVISKMPHEGALVALDPSTGEILALVGGRDFSKSKFNRATQAYRQPGSSFKPIVYAAALEDGYRGIDHILDAPLEFPNGWSPKNYTSNKFDGEVTLMTALAKSINTSAVRLAQIDGVDKVRDIARRLGITSNYLPDDLSISLGTASITPMELLVAYAAFANNGSRVEPYSIREVLSRKGEPLKQNGPKIENAISAGTAASMRSLLQQVINWGTGTKAKIGNYEMFGKTGTTNDWTDAWFVGGVPGLVVVVYVGNDNHKPLGGRSTGAIAALPVWKEFVQYAVEKLNLPTTFTVDGNSDIEEVTVCRDTGFLAADGCKTAKLLLPVGYVPTALCPWHGGSRSAAAEDENAPQFLIAPIDDDATVARYAMRRPHSAQQKENTQEMPQDTEVEEPVTVVQKKTEEKTPVKLPSAAERNPYAKEPSKESDIEAKYQELLKKYNITAD
ncbi:MAG: PBP1A family penicillin-binding protein [Synergistes sp.]|nr:PBP1A family penicillin-binding protein [Synergistes sp.]